MNDFTKEELQIILEGLLWRDAHIIPPNRPEKLKCKILSFLGNYCEHEIKISTSGENGHLMIQCMRCEKALYHEKD